MVSSAETDLSFVFSTEFICFYIVDNRFSCCRCSCGFPSSRECQSKTFQETAQHRKINKEKTHTYTIENKIILTSMEKNPNLDVREQRKRD